MRSLPIILLIFALPATSSAQFNPIGDVLKQILMAIDLRVQRAQTETVALQDAQKLLENDMQKTRLAEITSWVQQQRDMYEAYYQELWQVKTALKYYSAVKALIDKQARMIAGIRQASAAISRDRHFSVAEASHILDVYNGMLARSVDLVKSLETVIDAFVTQMEDGDRLKIINDQAAAIDRDYRTLGQYTQSNILLSLQRAKDENDINFIKHLYEL